MRKCTKSFRFWWTNFGWVHDPRHPGWERIPARADWGFQLEFADFALGLGQGSTQPRDAEAEAEAERALVEAARSGDILAANLLGAGSASGQQERRSFQLAKSREMGASVIACAVAAWEFLFRPGSSNVFVSLKREKVDDNKLLFNRSLFGKIRLIIRWCPRWMRPTQWRDLKRDRFDDSAMALVNSDNGASITGQSTDPDAIRGERAHRVWIDEANSIPWLDELLTSAKQVGPVGMISSVKGMSTTFARVWHGRGGVEVVDHGDHVGKPGVVKFRWHYSQRPDRHPDTPEGRAWRDRTRAEYTAEGWAQELEIDFAASAPGRIWSMFNPEEHVLSPAEWREVMGMRQHLRLVEGWDFGYTHTLTVVVWAYHDDRTDTIYVLDYRQWEGDTIDTVAQDYADAGFRCRRNPRGIEPDQRVGDVYSGGKGSRVEGGRVQDPVRSWITNLRDEDVDVRGQTLVVEDAISRVAKALQEGRCLFGPRCVEIRDGLPSLVESVSQYSRDVRADSAADHVGATPKPKKDVYSHAADALQHIAWAIR